MNHFDQEQLDLFREIGNIGAGNAATALATILDRRIDMGLPEAKVVPFDAIVNLLKGPETVVAGVLVDLSGDIEGYALFLLEIPDATAMMSMLLTDDLRSGDEFGFNELERSAILEISNILVGSFVTAIGTLTKLTISYSVPKMTIDMLGAIMSIAAVEYGKMGDSVLFLKAEFLDESKAIGGHFFLIPDYKSYKILLSSLGMG